MIQGITGWSKSPQSLGKGWKQSSRKVFLKGGSQQCAWMPDERERRQRSQVFPSQNKRRWLQIKTHEIQSEQNKSFYYCEDSQRLEQVFRETVESSTCGDTQNNWVQSWAICLSCCCLSREVGLDDLKRSLTTSTILWYSPAMSCPFISMQFLTLLLLSSFISWGLQLLHENLRRNS